MQPRTGFTVAMPVYGLFVIFVSPCACEPQPFEGRVSHGRYFEYHDREQEALCPELLPLLDEHAESVGSLIGSAPSSGDAFRYYKFRSFQELQASDDCPSESGGCAFAGEVLSPKAFDTHELSHAYTFAAWHGPFNALLSEGVAVALSCSPAARYTFEGAAPDWRDLLSLSGEEPNDNQTQAANHENAVRQYAAAGAFTTNLARRYGWARLAELYQRVPPGVSELDFQRQFSQVLPASVDHEWSLALGNGDAPACVPDPQCALDAQEDGQRLGAACVGAERPIDLVANIGARISFVGTGFTLQSCSDSTQTYWFVGSEATAVQTTHVLQLPRDRYLLVYDRDLPASDFALESYFMHSLVGDCGVSEPLQLEGSQPTIIDLPPGTTTGWLALNGASRYLVAPHPSILSGKIELCDQCGLAASSCSAIPVGESTAVTVTAGSWLKLDNLISLDLAQIRFTPTSVDP